MAITGFWMWLFLIGGLLGIQAAIALIMEDCGPLYTKDEQKCKQMMVQCTLMFNITIKWTGPGTKAKDGLPRGDGGCQCDQYCGFFSRPPCNRDKQCYWNPKTRRCFNRKTKQPGKPILICPKTETPTLSPSNTAPTMSPATSMPSKNPSKAPSTAHPSSSPTVSGPTAVPTTSTPSIRPSLNPTHRPSNTPSRIPTSSSPSHAPSMNPTHRPSNTPSRIPTSSSPSHAPSMNPTHRPSNTPSRIPTSSSPSHAPSMNPTHRPSNTPSRTPTSSSPSHAPSKDPTHRPSNTPSRIPTSSSPSHAPSKDPTTSSPSGASQAPSSGPSIMPSSAPSFVPTMKPTYCLSASPTASPTISPTITPRPTTGTCTFQETGWTKATINATCWIGFPGISKWGWTNGPYSTDPQVITFEIWGGAAQCDTSKGTYGGSGNATVNNDGSVTLAYSLAPGVTNTGEVRFYLGPSQIGCLNPGKMSLMDTNPKTLPDTRVPNPFYFYIHYDLLFQVPC